MFENWNFLKHLFPEPEQKQAAPRKVRSFVGARTNRFTQWLSATFSRINLDLDTDLLTLMTRTRELSKNNDVVRAYLEILEKNIIGATGFELQSQIKSPDGRLNEALNDEIEWKWYEFGKLSNGFLTIEGGMGHQEFDKLILRTLIIDGEVFIRVHKNVKNPFGLSFELIDGMSIDFTKRREFAGKQNAIVLGIEIDKNYRPVAYYTRPGTTIVYQAGKEEKIPASEIIHIYRKEFPKQVRGFSILNACLNDLKQIEDLDTAELFASKIAACLGLFYERNGQLPEGDFLNDAADDNGSFLQELSPRCSECCAKWLQC